MRIHVDSPAATTIIVDSNDIYVKISSDTHGICYTVYNKYTDKTLGEITKKVFDEIYK